MPSTGTNSNSTNTTCNTPTQYKLPIKDASCGIPNIPKYKPLLQNCAIPAKIQSYDNDCALYAPALNQSIQNLTNCLYEAGVEWEDVWCLGLTNSTATATYPMNTASATASSTRAVSTERDASTTAGVTTSASTSTTGLSSTSTSAPSYDNKASPLQTRNFSVRVAVALILFNLVFSGLF